MSLRLTDIKRKLKDFEAIHQKGHLSIENDEIVREMLGKDLINDVGLQIAVDGRIWLCVNGIAFIRFSPHANGLMSLSSEKV